MNTRPRKLTPPERAALVARIHALHASETPPLSFKVIAERIGVGPAFVSRALKAKAEATKGNQPA